MTIPGNSPVSPPVANAVRLSGPGTQPDVIIRNTGIAAVCAAMGCPVVLQPMQHVTAKSTSDKMVFEWCISPRSIIHAQLDVRTMVSAWPHHPEYARLHAGSMPEDRLFCAGMFAVEARRMVLGRLKGDPAMEHLLTYDRGDLWSIAGPRASGRTVEDFSIFFGAGEVVPTRIISLRTLAIACMVHGFPWQLLPDGTVRLALASVTISGLTLADCERACTQQLEYHQRAAACVRGGLPVPPPPQISLPTLPEWRDMHSFPVAVQTLANISELQGRLRDQSNKPWYHLQASPRGKSSILPPDAGSAEQDRAAQHAGL